MRAGVPAMMTVLHNRDRWDLSNVQFNGRMVLSHDKTLSGQPGIEWIDYGLSVYRTEIIAKWPEPEPFDLSNVSKTLAERGG